MSKQAVHCVVPVGSNPFANKSQIALLDAGTGVTTGAATTSAISNDGGRRLRTNLSPASLAFSEPTQPSVTSTVTNRTRTQRPNDETSFRRHAPSAMIIRAALRDSEDPACDVVNDPAEQNERLLTSGLP